MRKRKHSVQIRNGFIGSLQPAQRIHFAILTQARLDWRCARRNRYITTSGDLRPEKFRFVTKGGTPRRELEGFNTPTTPEDLHDLAEFWRGEGCIEAMRQLGVREVDAMAEME